MAKLKVTASTQPFNTEVYDNKKTIVVKVSNMQYSGNGVVGEDGAQGLSAYQVAVNNGFVGTEVEWLNSLKSVATSVTISNEFNNIITEKSDGIFAEVVKPEDILGGIAALDAALI